MHRGPMSTWIEDGPGNSRDWIADSLACAHQGMYDAARQTKGVVKVSYRTQYVDDLLHIKTAWER